MAPRLPIFTGVVERVTVWKSWKGLFFTVVGDRETMDLAMYRPIGESWWAEVRDFPPRRLVPGAVVEVKYKFAQWGEKDVAVVRSLCVVSTPEEIREKALREARQQEIAAKDAILHDRGVIEPLRFEQRTSHAFLLGGTEHHIGVFGGTEEERAGIYEQLRRVNSAGEDDKHMAHHWKVCPKCGIVPTEYWDSGYYSGRNCSECHLTLDQTAHGD
jgi:hypothetical protein